MRQVITRNPYRLVEDVEGIGFKTADRIAASLGIEQDSEYRLSAGVKYTLSDATAVAGHCYLPRPELALAARRILGNDPDLIERTIDSLILSHEIAAQICRATTMRTSSRSICPRPTAPKARLRAACGR